MGKLTHNNAPVMIGKAVITQEIAHSIGRMQENDNSEICSMVESIVNVKNFLIDLHGSDCDASDILGHLAEIRYIENALNELMYINENNNEERQ